MEDIREMGQRIWWVFVFCNFWAITLLSGDLVYLNVIGKPIISVNSFAVAQDLFQSRALLYSDRPQFPMMTLCDNNFLTFRLSLRNRIL